MSYSDTDLGENSNNEQSTSGMVIKMGTGAISWKSKLQTICALSTTEAEYISAVTAAQEMLWLSNLFKELGYPVTSAMPLFIDNKSAIAVAQNPEHHGRMKHLDLRYYWLIDAVEDGRILPEFVPTTEQPADIFTKALPRDLIARCREQLGLVL